MNIKIKNLNGEVVFQHDCEDNTIKLTVMEAIHQKIDLSGADLRRADLCRADLRWADLRRADLRRADLRRADLRRADLFMSDLRWADLRWADLRWADLSGADLRGADLDFSVLSFSCKSLKIKTDERLRVQLCFHFLSWIKNAENATETEKKIFEFCMDYANRFHRTDVERLNYGQE